MQKAKISEVFRSIQGEGPFTGTPQVFVRFYDCNLNCAWCDTPHAKEGGGQCTEYSAAELFEIIKPLCKQCSWVSLTGGEPLLHKNFLKELLPLLKKANVQTYLETNGVLHRELGEVLQWIDCIAMDIKVPSSTKSRALWDEHHAFLKAVNNREMFTKVVVTSDTSDDDMVRAAQLVAGYDKGRTFVLQPNYFELHNGVTKKCLHFQNICLQYLHDVRVMPQAHKIMKLR